MASEFKLPEVGENVEKAKVVRVLVSPGDAVQTDQAVLEIETEKATLEVPSNVAGQVGEVKVKPGDEIKVGQTIFTVDGGGGTAESGKKKTETKAPRKPAQAKESAAATAEEEAPQEDYKAPEPSPEQQKEESRRAEEQRDTSEPVATAPKPRSLAPGTQDSALERPLPQQTVPASPAVRRLAREIGVDINQVEGSGPGGRITVDDVKAHAREGRRPAPAEGIAGAPRPTVATGGELPDFSKWGHIERQELAQIRRVIAERMALSWQTVAHVHHHDLADITELEELRRRHNEHLAGKGAKLTLMPILFKVLAGMLRRHPRFNSSLDLGDNTLILKQYMHLGMAVDTERGLLVPVIRNVERKSVLELASEMEEIAQRARAGKVNLEEMRGGTFTVTNVGGIGGTSFNPIVNYPEAAILGVARARREQVVQDDDTVAIRTMLPLVLGYDHRVVDGAEAARFMTELVRQLSNPMDLLLSL